LVSIIRIYHGAQPPERQTQAKFFFAPETAVMFWWQVMSFPAAANFI